MHNLQPAKGARRTVKRVGRGNASGKGTTAGRGQKGQRARSGGRGGLKLLGMRHIMLQTPKLRGFRSLKDGVAEVSLTMLNEAFGDGDSITAATLKKRGLIPDGAKRAKVLATGTLGKRLNLKGVAYSEKAKEKIEAAGGTVG
jgi:large subunit ribosomal protein L15